MKLTKQKNHEVGRFSVFYRFFFQYCLLFVQHFLHKYLSNCKRFLKCISLKPLLNLILLTDEKFEKILLVNERTNGYKKNSF